MQKEENYAQLKVKELHNKQSLTNYYRSNYQEDKGSEFRSISRLKKNLSCQLFTVQKDAMTEVNAPGKDGGGWGGELSLHE